MSLRNRLILFYTGFFVLALLLLGCGIFLAVREALERDAEQDILAGTNQMLTLYVAGGQDNLNALVTSNGRIVGVQASGEFAKLFDSPFLIVQVFSPRGRLLGRSSDADPQMPLPSAALALDLNDKLPITREIDGIRFNSLITPLIFNRREQGTGTVIDQQIAGLLQVTRPMNDVDQTLGTLVLILTFGSVAALIITTLGVTLLSRRALAPVERVTRTAQSIVRAEDLGERVPVPESRDELHYLTVTINDLLGRLEALFVAQRRFVADVSHELRTPLTAMQGNLEILMRGGMDDRGLLEESLGDMRRETARLIRMVNDLLLLAQSDARQPLRCEPVELDTLLLELFRELRPLTNGVQLRIGAEDQIIVQGDRDRIKQAMLNLGVNALQHTPAGGSVTLGLERRESYACLSVSDTGEGISEADLPHIFERFYRADRSRSRHSGGAGLGLAIVERIAEAHNGYATVNSVVGRGSTFAIWLPLPPEIAATPQQELIEVEAEA
jgi:two-component system, OmpR family, sensor kinase